MIDKGLGRAVKRTMADKQDDMECNMTPDELKSMSAADRRIALTKFLGDAWETLMSKPAGEGGFDVESCFHGVCATMTADGMMPGHVPTFQSLKVHLKSNPDYKFTWDEPVIGPDDDDSDSQPEDACENEDVEDADDPNDPEEVQEDAGEEDADPASASETEGHLPMYTVQEMLELPLPDSITASWRPIADVAEANNCLHKNATIAHVFDSGWALGKLKKKVDTTYRVRYPDGSWDHELQEDMYGKYWHVMQKHT